MSDRFYAQIQSYIIIWYNKIKLMKKYFDAQIKLYLLWLDLLIEVHPWIQSYLLWLDGGIGWESVHGVYFGLRRPPASFYREQCRSLLCCIKFYRGPNNFIVSLPNQSCIGIVVMHCSWHMSRDSSTLMDSCACVAWGWSHARSQVSPICCFAMWARTRSLAHEPFSPAQLKSCAGSALSYIYI